MAKLDDYSYWIYGRPGIGKTTLANMLFSKCHNFMFEDGAKALAVYKRQIKSWPMFRSLIEQLEDSDFTASVTDTVEGAYEMCYDHVLQINGWDAPDDAGYGKGWKAIRDEFLGALRKLQTLPEKGCLFISHATIAERKTYEGETMMDVHPALSGKPLEMLTGAVDVIAYYHNKKGRHRLQLRGDDDVMAKVRMEDRFLYTDGTPIKFLDMGESKHEAVERFKAAFNNELDPPPPEEKKKPSKLRK